MRGTRKEVPAAAPKLCVRGRRCYNSWGAGARWTWMDQMVQMDLCATRRTARRTAMCRERG